MRPGHIILLFLCCCQLASSIVSAQDNDPHGCDKRKIDLVIMKYFDYADVDTFRIRKFVKNSGFRQAIDSFINYTPYSEYANDGMVDLQQWAITRTADWEIVINDTLIYRISDIEMGDMGNSRMVMHCALMGYKVNGVPHGYGNLIIEKPFTSDTCELAATSVVVTQGFDFDDLDTVKIVAFARNSNFTIATDSFYVSTPYREFKDGRRKRNGKINIPVSNGSWADRNNKFGRGMPSSVDWEVVFKNGVVFKISDAIPAYHRYHDGSIFRRCYIVSYRLNGVKMNGNTPELVNP